MPRYIDADKLVYQIERKIPSYTGGNDNFVRGFKDALLRFKSMVHSAKTADVQEVNLSETRPGKWIYKYKGTDHDDVAYCSLCNFYVEDKINNVGLCYKCCPNCFAKMDGGNDNE